MPSRRSLAAGALAAMLVAPSGAIAADMPTVAITIRNHQFHPGVVEVPARVRVRLSITNADPTPEEFESYPLNREKVIPGNARATLFIGPLDPGTYPFFGEFHAKTAQGRIVAK